MKLLLELCFPLAIYGIFGVFLFLLNIDDNNHAYNTAKSYERSIWKVEKTEILTSNSGSLVGVNITLVKENNSQVFVFTAPTTHSYILGRTFTWKLRNVDSSNAWGVKHFTELLEPVY